MRLRLQRSKAWDGRDVRCVPWSLCLRIVVLGLCASICACDDEGIRAYRAPKQLAKVARESATVSWIPPQGWEAVSSDQPTRVATFRPGEGLPEVSVTAFPGDSGGLLANINRWRGQMGLAAIDQAELARSAPTETVEGVKITTVDLTGAKGQEMLGAVVVPGDGKTWFVKVTGEPGAIAKIKPSFGVFARSFRFQGAPTGAAKGPAPAEDVHTRLKSWALPSNWRADPNPSTFITAAFDATNADGGSRITATALLNDGGGVLNNINRWREQMGLPLVEKLDQQPTTDLGGGNLVVELTAPDNTRRMIAAIVTSLNETWFFKLTGTPKGVEAERGSFDRFVRGVGLGKQTP